MDFLEYCQKKRIAFKFSSPRNTAQGVQVFAKFGEKIYHATAQNQRVARALLIEQAQADILSGNTKPAPKILVLPKTNEGKNKRYIDIKNATADKYAARLGAFAVVYCEIEKRLFLSENEVLYGNRIQGRRREDWEIDDISASCEAAKFSWQQTANGFWIKGVFSIDVSQITLEHLFVEDATSEKEWENLVKKYLPDA